MVQAELDSDLGNGHHMETGATLDPTGRLTATTHTYTVTKAGGFTGGVRVIFSNAAGVTIGASEETRFGVDGRDIGQSDRTDPWTQDIDPALAAQVTKLTIVHYWAPKVTVQQIVEIAVQTAELIVELISQLNTDSETNAG